MFPIKYRPLCLPDVPADCRLHVFLDLLGKLAQRRKLEVLVVAHYEVAIERLLVDSDPYHGQLIARLRHLAAIFSKPVTPLAKISIFVLGELNTPIFAYKNQALAGEDCRREIIL